MKIKDYKCIVFKCPNRTTQGKFVGVLCYPCYDYITKNEGVYSQAYRNALTTARELLKDTK